MCNKMIQEKKSQAAMEFMVTYGWIIIGVMIVISTLAYFGIFNTGKYVNDECSFGTQLYCEDLELNNYGSDNNMRIKFRNNFGQDIYVSNMVLYYDGKRYDYDGITANSVVSGSSIELNGSIKNFPLAKNDKIKFTGVVQFRRNVAGAPIHNVTGTIITTVK